MRLARQTETDFMANRRDLKRAINEVCCDLFAECIAVAVYNNQNRDEDAGVVLALILSVNDDFLSRVSHKEPGLSGKEYFKKVAADFAKQVDEITGQIDALG